MMRSFLLLFILPFFSFGGNESVLNSKPQVFVTMQCAGIQWHIDGDDNGSATCSVEYRQKGETSWEKALSLFRVPKARPSEEDQRTIAKWDKNKRGYVTERWKYNYLAGSIFGLKEGTDYEVKLVFRDKDGGEAEEIVTARTREYPKLPDRNGKNTIEVKNDGPKALKKALKGAKEGDLILVHAGRYEGNLKVTKRLAIAAFGDGEVILEGSKQKGGEEVERGVDVLAPGCMFYGLTIKSFAYGMHLMPAAHRTSIMKCSFFDNHYSVEIKSSENYIADNVIVGDNAPAEGSFDGEGIETHGGFGQVICHNSITKVADPISIETPESDVFGNDCFNTSDDGIETDDSGPNLRIFNNRFYSCQHNGVSFQPYVGGPVYFIRNQVAGMRENCFKDRYFSSGAVMINNTFLNNSPLAIIMHVYSRNNIFSAWGGPLNMHDVGGLNPGYDFDHDCLVSRLKISAEEIFEDIGGEKNGILVKPDGIFSKPWVIAVPPAVIEPAPMFELKDGCKAVDAGIEIPNITGTYIGKAPDMGALEKGAPFPHYGPRD